MIINPVIHVLPIIYEGLSDPGRFLIFCKKVVENINKSDLFKHYKIKTFFAESLIQFSGDLIKNIIPPPNLRYNAMNGWLTVGDKIRARLGFLKTSKPVEEGSSVNYPNLDKGDIIIAMVPLSIRTSPEIWREESHFGQSGSPDDQPLKTISFPYHISLVDQNDAIIEDFYKEYDSENIAYQIIENIAAKNMGISDVQMETMRIIFGYEIKDKGPDKDTLERLRVFFYGNDICSPTLLKEAILLFDDIHFQDHPSFKIGALGSIGTDSRIRPYVYSFAKDGVPILVHKGNVDWTDSSFTDSVAMELEDPRFSEIFFDGFKSNKGFRNLFIQEQANYGKGKGFEISQAMMKLNLGGKPYDLSKYRKLNVHPFDPGSTESLENTFAHFLMDASMKLNFGCIISHENDLIPFTEYETLDNLLKLRHKRIIERGEKPEKQQNAKLFHLSHKLFTQILPVELIEKASFEDIIRFRKETKGSLIDFRKYLMRLNFRIESEVWNEEFERELNKILANEVLPAIDEFQKSCKQMWEKMFGEITKDLLSSGSLTALISCFTGYSFFDLFIKGCGIVTPIALKRVVDYALEKRNLVRKNALSYLISIKSNLK